ncbi:MAG: hypothetical protein ACI8R9_001426 [Paraglaciecola sp.]|jgi:hypothetical protein
MDNGPLILYSGKNCCLCDEAQSLLLDVCPQAQFEKIDVRADAQLYHQYGARIPVLQRQDSAKELAWPFNKQQLSEFLY